MTQSRWLHSVAAAFSATVLLSAFQQVPTQRWSEDGIPSHELAFVVQRPDGVQDLLLDDGSGRLQLMGSKVVAMNLPLVGYPQRDRFRLDLPRQAHGDLDGEGPLDDGGFGPVQLPSGARLYTFSLNGRPNLLLHDTRGRSRWLLPKAPLFALKKGIHVSADGKWAVVATDKDFGGDLHVIDLEGDLPPSCLTRNLPPLAIDIISVRVSDAGVWFVAKDILYHVDRSVAGPRAVAVSLGLDETWKVLPELTLSGAGGLVAAIVERDGDELRRIIVVNTFGVAATVTDVAATYLLPGYLEVLGPYITISPDETLIAYIRSEEYTYEEGSDSELFVRQIPNLPAPVHVTSEPEFPLYIDNIGLLAFPDSRTLCFLGGDQIVSGIFGREILASAEMYAVKVSNLPTMEYINVTLTNGQTSPPFDVPATLTVEMAVVGPHGQRIFFAGEEEDTESWRLAAFRINAPEAELGVVDIFPLLDEEPELRFVGSRALVVTEGDESDSLWKVEFEGTLDVAVTHLGTWDALAEFTRFVGNPSKGQAAFLLSHLDGRHEVMGVNLNSETLGSVLRGRPQLVSESLAFDPLGRLVVGLQYPGQSFRLLSIGPSPRVIAVLAPGSTAHPLE